MHSATALGHRVLSRSLNPANWESFLCVPENKEELFLYLSQAIEAFDAGEKLLITTHDNAIIMAGQNAMQGMEFLQPCTWEEADTRTLLHVAHCSRLGHRRIAI